MARWPSGQEGAIDSAGGQHLTIATKHALATPPRHAGTLTTVEPKGNLYVAGKFAEGAVELPVASIQLGNLNNGWALLRGKDLSGTSAQNIVHILAQLKASPDVSLWKKVHLRLRCCLRGCCCRCCCGWVAVGQMQGCCWDAAGPYTGPPPRPFKCSLPRHHGNPPPPPMHSPNHPATERH